MGHSACKRTSLNVPGERTQAFFKPPANLYAAPSAMNYLVNSTSTINPSPTPKKHDNTTLNYHRHRYMYDLRNHCNIVWVDGGIYSKNGGKTAKRMMRTCSLHVWCVYLHQPKKYCNESLSFCFDTFKRKF